MSKRRSSSLLSQGRVPSNINVDHLIALSKYFSLLTSPKAAPQTAETGVPFRHTIGVRSERNATRGIFSDTERATMSCQGACNATPVSAFGAKPVEGEISEGGALGYVVLWHALCLVIHKLTHIANPLFHCFSLQNDHSRDRAGTVFHRTVLSRLLEGSKYI